MEIENAWNIRVSEQEKRAELLAKWLDSREEIYSVRRCWRTVQFADGVKTPNPGSKNGIENKVVDAPYIQAQVKYTEYDTQEFSQAVVDELNDAVEFYFPGEDGLVEFHMTYGLKGGDSYSPLLEQSIDY